MFDIIYLIYEIHAFVVHDICTKVLTSNIISITYNIMYPNACFLLLHKRLMWYNANTNYLQLDAKFSYSIVVALKRAE